MKLSGLVAVLSEDGQSVEDVRDLGPDPVGVKPGRVLPLVDSDDAVPDGFAHGDSSYTIEAERIVRSWALVAVPPPVYRVYRAEFAERMTPEEAATLEAALDAAEPKLRLMYQSVDYFLSDDPLFAVLHWTVASALGSEAEPDFARADVLLAPSD